MSKPHSALKETRLTIHQIVKNISKAVFFVIIGVSAIVLGTSFYLLYLDITFTNKIYPKTYIGTYNAGGKTPQEIINDWKAKNLVYKDTFFELRLGTTIATLSGEALNLGYDEQLIAKQSYLVSRSGNILSDMYTKLLKEKTVITPYFRWNEDILDSTLSALADSVNIPPEDAKFSFSNGRVNEFKPATPGKRLNQLLAKQQFNEIIKDIPYSSNKTFPIVLSVETIQPSIATSQSNQYGIQEKIGTGYSEFFGSIPGRIHNISLAASKFNGVLIAPGEIVSFNKLVGDISQQTGYQTAYIIKEGRTVLGDGGGVCQVSTTLFRAALNAGLPIVEWSPHAYRVSYYEQAGYKPGLDATIFVPSVDLKFKNDTSHSILIQTTTDKKNLSLTIDLFGTYDGRKAEISNHQILSQSPAPPPLYQDDPTLSPGVVKQVDWAASGAKTIFSYKVTRGNEVLTERQFVANYRPWQAVYLRGPQI